MHVKSKIILLQELKPEDLPQKKKVLVGGCFDVLHIGHVRFLEGAKSKGDVVIVALESDEFIEIYKKRKPFHTQHERAEILAALVYVDLVILLPLLQTYEAYRHLVQTIRPSIIAVTEGDTQITNKSKQVQEIGGSIAIIPQEKNTSSSAMVEFFEKDPLV